MWEYLIGLFALLRALTGIRFFLIKRRVKGSVRIIPEAEPFFNKVSGNKVALLIHCFGSSPREFRDLSKYLAKKGISSYAPLLPGHGTSPERLAVVKYYQWIESVEEHIDMLSKNYEEIYIVGNSLGGNLALICSNYSSKIKGIVTLGTPIVFKNEFFYKRIIFPIFRRIKLFQKKKYSKAELRYAKKNPTLYMSIPVTSLIHVSKIIKLSKKELHLINCKVMALYSKPNKYQKKSSSSLFLLDKDSAEYLAENIKFKKSFAVAIGSKFHNIIYSDNVEDYGLPIYNFINTS